MYWEELNNNWVKGLRYGSEKYIDENKKTFIPEEEQSYKIIIKAG